jgi:hypothetical protein
MSSQGNGVVHNDPLPQMRTVGNELLVDRVLLINVLAGDVVEEQELGCAVARIDDRALLSACRHADVHAAHGARCLRACAVRQAASRGLPANSDSSAKRTRDARAWGSCRLVFRDSAAGSAARIRDWFVCGRAHESGLCHSFDGAPWRSHEPPGKQHQNRQPPPSASTSGQSGFASSGCSRRRLVAMIGS